MLLDEIITLLGDQNARLSDALLKTKILLHQIGKKELAEWVNHELNGYPETAALPEYRILGAQVRCQAASISLRYPDMPVPISHLDKKKTDSLTKTRMHQSLTVLEDMVKKDGQLIRELPMELNGLLGQTLAHGWSIIMAWCATPSHDVKGIMTQVRSRLLDFVLELKDSLGDIALTEETLKKEVAKIDTASMFQQAVFGGTTNIFVGNQNLQQLQMNVQKGDINTLTQSLTDVGIEAEDIKALKAAIADDEKSGKASLEGHTGSWLMRMLTKAGKGSLKIGSEVASKVLVEALNKYIG